MSAPKKLLVRLRSKVVQLKRAYYRRKFLREMDRAARTLQELNTLMKKAGFTRGERRRFWREFVKKNGTTIEELTRRVARIRAKEV